MRVAGALLVIACVAAVVGAGLPWLAGISVSRETGATTRLSTRYVWSGGGGWLFALFAIPLAFLGDAGLRAVRGRPPKIARRRAVRLALWALLGVVVFEILLAFASGFLISDIFDPGWGRGGYVDILVEPRFTASVASYLLAALASQLFTAAPRPPAPARP